MIKNIVLVHGINDNGATFGPFRRDLESAGFRVFTPSLTPNNGKAPLEMLADQLAVRINKFFGLTARLHVVGFSMGGLVARHYVQEMGGYRRAVSLTTIAAPNHGTVWAFLNNRPGIRQMRPGSDFLVRLAASEHRLAGLDIRAYWTPYDSTIVPARNCVWPRAENVRISSPLHHLMGNQPHLRADFLNWATQRRETATMRVRMFADEV